MLNFKQKYALSDKGAKSMLIASVANVFYNLALFSPVILLYLLIQDIMGNHLEGRLPFYIIGVFVWVIIIDNNHCDSIQHLLFLHLPRERGATYHTGGKIKETSAVILCKKR